MRIEHDPDADAIYSHMRDGTFARNLVLDHRRVIDLDAEKQPLGIELLTVSQGVGVTCLPEEAALRTLLSEQGFAVTGSSVASSRP